MQPRSKLLSSVLGAAFAVTTPALASPAHAAPDDGLAVGARLENGRAGIGIDYWRGGTGLTLTLAGGAGEGESRESDPWQADGHDVRRGGWIGGSVGVLHVVAGTPRVQLAAGARVAYFRSGNEVLGEPDEFVSSWRSLQLPVRLRARVAERVWLHVDLGVSFDRSDERWVFGDGAGAVSSTRESSWRTASLLADPLANLGVMYAF